MWFAPVAQQVLELSQYTDSVDTLLAAFLQLDFSHNAALLTAITTRVLTLRPKPCTPDLPVLFIPDKVSPSGYGQASRT